MGMKRRSVTSRKRQIYSLNREDYAIVNSTLPLNKIFYQEGKKRTHYFLHFFFVVVVDGIRMRDAN